MLLDKDQFEVDIIESETLSTFHHILKLFINGWKAEEIAQKLGKNKQTIYNKKSEAIAYLKNKLSKDSLLLLFILNDYERETRD